MTQLNGCTSNPSTHPTMRKSAGVKPPKQLHNTVTAGGKNRTTRRVNGRITGQGMTEYIIIVALIALASIVSINLFGNSVRAAFGGLASVLGGGDSAAAAGAATAASGEILNEAAKARKLDGYEK